MYAEATPGGVVEKKALDELMHRMFEALKPQLPVDGVLVVPHGAGVSEAYRDMDGHWLSELRKLVGPDIPIIGTIDPHANLSHQMVEATDALVAYKTNPHIDQREVGRTAGQMMANTLSGKIKPVQKFCRLPLAISIEQQLTKADPCKSVLELAEQLVVEFHLLSASLVLGFPYADVEDMGSSLIVVADGNAAVAEKALAKLEAYMMLHKEAFNGTKQDLPKLLASLDQSGKPILLLDMGDNVGGGAAGDSVYLLDLLEDAGKTNAFICLFDPEAVAIAFSMELHSSFEMEVGYRPDGQIRRKRKLTLMHKGDGKFEEQNPRHGGQVHFDMGKMAIVRTAQGNLVMLTSKRVPPYSLCQLTAFGIQPESFDLIVAKGVNAPIAAYKDVCKSIVQVDTPGVTQADMTRFVYEHRRKPLYPFENV